MAKYDPLRDHLRANGAARVTLMFDQIAKLVGGLPRSAKDHQAWWANEENPTTHVQKLAWMAAGYHVESVNQARGIVTFAKR